MKQFCFLIDTSFDLNFDLGEDVYILPPEIIETVNGNDKIYQDTIDITRDQIRSKLSTNADLRTSQTPYGRIYEKIEELLQQYRVVYCIVITKEFSGMFETYNKIGKQLEKEYGKNRVFVIDSRATAIDQNWVLELVRKEAKKSSSFFVIEKQVKHLNQSICGFTIVSNAKQLVKGGRLTGIKGLLVKSLKIKLIIRYTMGALKFIDKSIDFETAIDKGLEDTFEQLKIPKNEIDKVVIFSDLDKQQTEKYTKYVESKLKEYYKGKFIYSQFPTIVITHLGDFSFSVMLKVK